MNRLAENHATLVANIGEYHWAVLSTSKLKLPGVKVDSIDSQENRVKREALSDWVKAVNEDGGFGEWAWDVSFNPSDLEGILRKAANDNPASGN